MKPAGGSVCHWFSWLPTLIFFLCMDLGKAGVGDDLRQRNVFPLPEIAHDEAGSHSDPFWRDLANQGIKTLNELSEGVNSSFESKKKTTRVQRRVQSQILEAFVDAYPRDSCLDHAGGLEKLCSSFRLYGSVRTDIKPYAGENISWPQASSRPVPLGRCLTDADREWLGTWRSHMLRTDASKVQEKVVPYVDPILKNNPHEYGGFLKELHVRGMLRYRIAHGECGKLGIFFVSKKSGQLRLIFDTRLLNQDFEEPPNTDLPSADAFTRMEMPEGHQFYIGSGDLSNAFYTLSVPEELGRMFTLPCIKARHLGLIDIDGTAVRPDTQVLPYLTVLPMGWSWALHLCQLVIMNAINAAGISDSQIIGHKRGAVQLHDPDSIAVAGYVDNFGIFGCNPASVDQGRMRIAEQLRRWGLSVHEEEQAQLKGEFVGLFFNGEKGYVSIKPSRLLKLRAGIEDLLSKQFCTGRVLQLVLGHCTWAMMARRESLSILHHCYSFCHKFQNTPTRLWPSVRQELTWIASILPLLRCKINNGWSTDVTASDSSPWGLGVCSRQLDVSTVASIGSVSERWRFKFEDATRARKHALFKDVSDDDPADCCHKQLGSGSLQGTGIQHDEIEQSGTDDARNDMNASVSTDSFSNFICQQGFNEISTDLLKPEDWAVVWSKPWRFQANILNTEARALGWSVEHLLRSNRNINKRLLCFSDNLPLVLGACKGRAKSGYLLKPLRRITSLLLATGSRLAVRWIASELNVADAPSRAIAIWKKRNLERWWEDFIKEPFRHHCGIGGGDQDQPHAAEPGGLSRKGIPKAGSSSESGGVSVCASGFDLFGGEKRQEQNSKGLSAAHGQVHHVVEGDHIKDSDPRRSRLLPGRVHERDVFERGGHRRRNSNPCGRQVFLPLPWPTSSRDPSPSGPGPEGMVNGFSTKTTIASTSGSLGSDHGQDSGVGSPSASAAIVHPVPDLSSTRGVVRIDSGSDDCASVSHVTKVQYVGHPASSSGGGSSRKDWHLRCHSALRLGSMDGPLAESSDNEPKARRDALARPSPEVGQRVQQGRHRSGTRAPGNLPLHLEAWRGDSRHSDSKKKHAGGQTKRPLAVRQLTATICEVGKTSTRTVKDSKVSVRNGASSDRQPSSASSCRAAWNPTITKRMSKKAAAKPCSPAMSGVQLLRKMFKEACKKSRERRRQVFLDLFCGDQGISKSITRHGFGVVSIDINLDSRLDLARKDIQNLLLGWIRSGCVIGVWLATPGTTWCQARHGPVNSSWGPLRDSQHLFGLPDLKVHDRLKVKQENQTALFTCKAIHACKQNSIPCILENPSSSMMWQIPFLVRLCSLSCSRCVHCDFCQFGAKWRKRTRVQGWFVQDCSLMNQCCQGRNGWCPLNQRFHIALKGQDPVSKQLWTHLAQPYPTRFAAAGAKLLIDSSYHVHNFVLRQRFGN